MAALQPEKINYYITYLKLFLVISTVVFIKETWNLCIISTSSTGCLLFTREIYQFKVSFKELKLSSAAVVMGALKVKETKHVYLIS